MQPDQSAEATARREQQRASALARYGILDTPPEQAFDQIALLAAALCQTPVAMVTFVDDDRFWFKAKIGMPDSSAPRCVAPCEQLFAQPVAEQTMTISDFATDDRLTAQRDILMSKGLRSYAGAQLVTPDGHAVGTICVFDTQIREFPPEKVAGLAVLARQTMKLLELRRQTPVPAPRPALPGLPGRDEFDHAMLSEGARAHRSDRPLALLLARPDDHDTPAAMARLAALTGKIARPDDFIGGFDDDTIAMILPATTHQQSLALAARLRQAWPDLSIGIGSRLSGSDSASMILTAMTALLLDKASRGTA